MTENATILLFLAALFPYAFGAVDGTLLAVAVGLFLFLFKKISPSCTPGALFKKISAIPEALKKISVHSNDFKKIGFPGPELAFKKF